jgi:hypothetical protein
VLQQRGVGVGGAAAAGGEGDVVYDAVAVDVDMQLVLRQVQLTQGAAWRLAVDGCWLSVAWVERGVRLALM